MRLEIHGVDVKITPDLEERIHSKLSKFNKYFDDKAVCQVKVSTDGPTLKRVEITLHVDRRFYRAERSEDDVYTALDSAIDVLHGQIRKHKTVMSNISGAYDNMQEFIEGELMDTDVEEVDDTFDVRYKQFEIFQMSDEEAALQMELLGHSFFIYLSADDDQVNVIYKRRGDSYGVIQPIYE